MKYNSSEELGSFLSSLTFNSIDECKIFFTGDGWKFQQKQSLCNVDTYKAVWNNKYFVSIYEATRSKRISWKIDYHTQKGEFKPRQTTVDSLLFNIECLVGKKVNQLKRILNTLMIYKVMIYRMNHVYANIFTLKTNPKFDTNKLDDLLDFTNNTTKFYCNDKILKGSCGKFGNKITLSLILSVIEEIGKELKIKTLSKNSVSMLKKKYNVDINKILIDMTLLSFNDIRFKPSNISTRKLAELALEDNDENYIIDDECPNDLTSLIDVTDWNLEKLFIVSNSNSIRMIDGYLRDMIMLCCNGNYDCLAYNSWVMKDTYQELYKLYQLCYIYRNYTNDSGIKDYQVDYAISHNITYDLSDEADINELEYDMQFDELYNNSFKIERGLSKRKTEDNKSSEEIKIPTIKKNKKKNTWKHGIIDYKTWDFNKTDFNEYSSIGSCAWICGDYYKTARIITALDTLFNDVINKPRMYRGWIAKDTKEEFYETNKKAIREYLTNNYWYIDLPTLRHYTKIERYKAYDVDSVFIANYNLCYVN